MVDREQVLPLAPTTTAVTTCHSSDDAEAALHVKKKFRHQKCIKCCGCVTVTLLTLIILFVILYFTVFRVKDPIITMNGVKVTQLEMVNGLPKPGVNISLVADVSVKNPNAASFRYSNVTTTIYYHGQLVGEARNGAGQSKARRTSRMNVTVDVIPDRIMSSPSFNSDFGSGVLPMTTFSRVPGKMKMVVVKKHIVVKMNCSMILNVTSQEIQTQKCKRNVDLF